MDKETTLEGRLIMKLGIVKKVGSIIFALVFITMFAACDSNDEPISQAAESKSEADRDADGIADVADNCIDVVNEDQANIDGDAMGDVCDDDIDGDGVANAEDVFPRDASEQSDNDNDGVGDSADSDDDNDGIVDSEDIDADGDGVANLVDNCPSSSNPSQSNIDEDAMGDACDNDMDGDVVANVADAFPTNPQESVDTDDDGIGNNADPDDDNDEVVDAIDSLPLVPNQSDVPTDGEPSPLFGAKPFEQQMILFEEFGTDVFDPNEPAPLLPFPQPVSDQSGPLSAELDAFLAQSGLAPYATRLAADEATYENPWAARIDAHYGVAFETQPAEGRPQGEDWAHQRWDEFYPKRYFKTAQAGARTNGGIRDVRQRHGYAVGEFGPGGLYHTVYTSSVPGAPTLVATTTGLPIQLHPRMPVQDKNSVWTFDGTLPPKLLQGRYGEPILMRHYDALPIDDAANNGFGLHTITTHDHNGHNPGESDGFAGAFFYPGQFYDYHWPMVLAGYDTINTNAAAPNAAFPCSPGESIMVDEDDDGIPTPRNCDASGRIQIRGDWRETMSTHWFHDHMLDHTAENVYKGNATMFNYYSALDRGNEAVNDGVNLRLPSGTALPWGNRDYDINLLVADKAWDEDGQLFFSHDESGGHDGFLGDRMTVNWLYKPYFEVRARRYRFRILNGSVSRIMAIALVQKVNGLGGEIPGPEGSGISYNRVPFHLVANDGNIMEHTVPFDGSVDLDGDGDLIEHKGQLPSQTIAERYDIVVDFSKHGIQPGDKLYFVNILEHFNGKVTERKVPLAEILSEAYKPQLLDDDLDGISDRWINGDPCDEMFLELRVMPYAGVDQSMNPADYEPGKLKMIPLPIDRNDPVLANATHHTFEFVRSQGGSATPWKIKVDGGEANSMDPHRISALADGELEIWQIKGTNGWTHPVHIHFEEGVYLTRDRKIPPAWELWARKDMYRIGPEDDSGTEIEVAIRARDFVGTYVEHCHNTMHEDHAMLLRWDATRNELVLMPTPMPTWDGVDFEPSNALPDAENGDGVGPQ